MANNQPTQRLYYTDSYLTQFAARVVAHTVVDGNPALILDQTAFYPTSGGQPYDTGTLAGLAVLDVVAENDHIVHVLDAPIVQDAPLVPEFAAVGTTIHGEVDWPRRFDHMQQHTGQHLISQVFAQLFDFETVAVHFGVEESTLDLDTPDLTPEQLSRAEQVANARVYEALPIRAYMIVDSELGDVPLRRPPKVKGQIRIVEIHRWDYSACGGTHCRTTAEVGLVKFLHQERRKNTTRITFLCGGRAYRDYARRHALLAEIAGMFSADVARAPELTANLMAQNSRLQRQIDEFTADVAVYAARELAEEAQSVGEYALIVRHCENRTVDWLKAVAGHLQAEPKQVAVLASVTEGKTTLMIGRGENVPLHAGQILRALLSAFGGGGGGRPELAQGGGVAPDQMDALLAAARQRIQAELTGNPAN